MPLLDHFRSPAFEAAPWTSVGSFWMVYVARQLNRMLPDAGYRAFVRAHLGNMAEADIGEYEREPGDEWGGFGPATDGGLATAVVPPPTATGVPVLPDQFEIQPLQAVVLRAMLRRWVSRGWTRAEPGAKLSA